MELEEMLYYCSHCNHSSDKVLENGKLEGGELNEVCKHERNPSGSPEDCPFSEAERRQIDNISLL